MNDTGFTIPQEKIQRVCPQYQYEISSQSIHRIPNNCIGALGDRHESGGGGLITTVQDYILFADSLACSGISKSGSRILSQRSVDLMRRNQLDEKKLNDFRKMGYSKGSGYGLGVGTIINSALANTIAPEGVFYWGGIGGVQVLIDPINKLSLFIAQHIIK